MNATTTPQPPALAQKPAQEAPRTPRSIELALDLADASEAKRRERIEREEFMRACCLGQMEAEVNNEMNGSEE